MLPPREPGHEDGREGGRAPKALRRWRDVAAHAAVVERGREVFRVAAVAQVERDDVEARGERLAPRAAHVVRAA